jgi:hypothetical protein
MHSFRDFFIIVLEKLALILFKALLLIFALIFLVTVVVIFALLLPLQVILSYDDEIDEYYNEY